MLATLRTAWLVEENAFKKNARKQKSRYRVVQWFYDGSRYIRTKIRRLYSERGQFWKELLELAEGMRQELADPSKWQSSIRPRIVAAVAALTFVNLTGTLFSVSPALLGFLAAVLGGVVWPTWFPEWLGRIGTFFEETRAKGRGEELGQFIRNTLPGPNAKNRNSMVPTGRPNPTYPQPTQKSRRTPFGKKKDKELYSFYRRSDGSKRWYRVGRNPWDGKFFMVLALAFCCSGSHRTAQAACQSCVFLSAHRHQRQHLGSPRAAWGQALASLQHSTRVSEWKRLAVHKLSRATTAKPALAAATVVCGITATCFLPRAVSRHSAARKAIPWLQSQETQDDQNGGEAAESENGKTDKPAKEDSSPVATSMISALGFYKAVISPLLPPACRFLPTCSQYGVQAIEQFGPGKGSILIAWRLLRCSPIGGQGIDYPQWPPVAFNYGSWTP